MKSLTERALAKALRDAKRVGLAVHEAKLIQARIAALDRAVERERDDTISRLTGELAAARAEIERMKTPTRHSPVNDTATEIEAFLAKHNAR